MEFRKKLGSENSPQTRFGVLGPEKSLEISAFLPRGVPQGGFHRSDLNRPKDLAGAEGIEPSARGFGDRCSTC